MVRDGDTIWSTVRPNRRSFALIHDPVENQIVSTGFAVLTPQNCPSSYLYLATTTEEFTSFLVNRARGAAYPAVTGKDFDVADMAVPKKSVLQDFDAQVEPMLRLTTKLKQKNTNLRQTRDLLLPKLIFGKIDVSGLYIDIGAADA